MVSTEEIIALIKEERDALQKSVEEAAAEYEEMVAAAAEFKEMMADHLDTINHRQSCVQALNAVLARIKATEFQQVITAGSSVT